MDYAFSAKALDVTTTVTTISVMDTDLVGSDFMARANALPLSAFGGFGGE